MPLSVNTDNNQVFVQTIVPDLGSTVPGFNEGGASPAVPVGNTVVIYSKTPSVAITLKQWQVFSSDDTLFHLKVNGLVKQIAATNISQQYYSLILWAPITVNSGDVVTIEGTNIGNNPNDMEVTIGYLD